jgi:hypothetical protein
VRILFDQGTPVPLRRSLSAADVATAFECGWSTLSNGELLAAAEGEFDLLITTDRNIKYQQARGERRVAILVLPTTSWPRIRDHVGDIERAIASITPGEYRELQRTD